MQSSPRDSSHKLQTVLFTVEVFLVHSGLFQRQKISKAPGPDGVSPSCLKVCADQLTPIFTQIFNRSLELCEACFKRSNIIQVPRETLHHRTKLLQALSSVVMKSFQKLVLTHLKDNTGPLLDPLQFARQTGQWMMLSR